MLGRLGHRQRPLTSGYRGTDRRVWMDQPAGGAWGSWQPQQVTSKVYSGAEQTVDLMARSILDDASHFETRQLAEAVCEGLDSKDYMSEYLALYQHVLGSTRYMRDPRRVELVRAPHVIARMMLEGHRPSIDCDDCATLLGALILCVGGRAEIVTVAFAPGMTYEGRQQYSHVFVRALEPRSRKYVVLDPVAAEKTPEMLRRVKAYKIWPIAA